MKRNASTQCCVSLVKPSCGGVKILWQIDSIFNAECHDWPLGVVNPSFHERKNGFKKGPIRQPKVGQLPAQNGMASCPCSLFHATLDELATIRTCTMALDLYHCL